jgi:PKD repeat protein
MGDNSYAGAVYVYNTDGTGEVKITASDGAGNDLFGWSSTISDTHVVAGSIQSNSMAGSAYIYNLDGTGEVKLTASDGAASDNFGQSVAVTDSKVIVGARYKTKSDNTGTDIGNAGAVYIYTLDGTGEVKLTASDAAGNDNFGSSVAIHGDKIIVGAVYADYNQYEPNKGAVYVYNTDGTGEVKITASDRNMGDGFGVSVAISDTKIVVGAWENDDAGTSSGSAYIYNLDGTGEVKLTASDAAARDKFGRSVAIQGDKIIVGAFADDDNSTDSGSVYVYNTDGTGEVKITASDATAGASFGYSVA